MTIGTTVCLARHAVNSTRLLGSGFVVGQDLIATAAHVCGPSDRDLIAVLPEGMDGGYQDTVSYNLRTCELQLLEYDPIRDLAILRLTAGNCQLSYELGSTDDIKVGASVYSVGFPHTDAGRVVLTYTTSTVGARVLLGTEVLKTKQIVLNMQARPGQSGSPVFSFDGQKVVGVILGAYAPGGGNHISIGGVDPHTLHQTTHAISAEYLRDML